MAGSSSPGPQRSDPDSITSHEAFGEGLKLLSQHAGWTQRGLADEVGVPVTTISGYFTGRHLPHPDRVDVLMKIIRACGEDEAAVERWRLAYLRLRRVPGPRRAGTPPYKGLACYEADDARWFFGRDAQISALVNRLVTAHRSGGILMVVGASGAGKSSLLRAGLIAGLRRGLPELPGSESWPVLLCTPGQHPVHRLAQQLGAQDGQVADLIAEPRRWGELIGADSHSSSVNTPTVLVIDQFEEVFAPAVDLVERQSFLDALHALADRRNDQPAVVILGLRADFYRQVLGDPRLVRITNAAQHSIGPMSREELRQAIVEPAHQNSLRIDDGLVERLLHEMAPQHRRGTEKGHEAGALPLLSHALLATWEHCDGTRLRMEDYDKTDGITGAVGRTAEEIYQSLTAPQQKMARQLFLRLVHVDPKGVDTRVPVLRDDLIGENGEVEDLLDQFVRHRLITADDSSIQISHEALLNAWQRLHDWVEDDRERLLIHQRLTKHAEDWEQENRSPAALYYGSRLADALSWQNSDEVPHRVREFLAASATAERRRLRRLRQIAACLAGLLVIAIAAGTVAVQERAQTLAQQALTRKERDRAISRVLAGRAEQLRTKDISLARQLSLVAYRTAVTPEARASLIDTSALPSVTRVPVSDSILQSVAFSPDGHLAATASADHAVRLWAVTDTHHPVPAGSALAGTTDIVYSVAFSPDSHLLAAAGADHAVHLWRLTRSGQSTPLVPLYGITDTVYSVAFSPDSHLLAAASADGTVHLWNLADPERPTPLAPLTGDTDTVYSATFSPDSHLLAAASADGTARLWNLTDPRHPQREAPLTGPKRPIFTVAFSPDGRLLAAGSADKDAYLWNVSHPTQPAQAGIALSGATSWVNTVAFSKDGNTLAAGSSDDTVRLWDVHTRQTTATLPHPKPVTAAVFYPGTGNSLATAAADGTLRLWSLATPALPEPDIVNAAVFSPDGRMLAIASSEVQLVNPTTRQRIGPPMTNAARFSGAVAFTPDGRTLAVGSHDGTVQLWNISDPTRPQRRGPPLRAHNQVVESLAFSPDGHTLATASDDYTVRLWQIDKTAPPRALATLSDFGSYVYSVVFSAHGHLLAAASVDRTVRLWNVADPEHPRPVGHPLTGSANYMMSVAFSPDGRLLAAGNADGTIRLWSLTDPNHPTYLAPPLTGPAGYVYALAFNANGHTLAAATTDGTLWLWDLQRPRAPTLSAELTVPTDALYTVGFSADGRTLAAGGASKDVWLWRTDLSGIAASICTTAGQPITAAEWHQYISDLPYQSPCPSS